jgi:Fe-S-cluster containining protein
VRLYDIDLQRLEGTGLRVIHQPQGSNGSEPVEIIPKLAIRLDDQGHRVCAAFEGQLGGPCACGIYERRPEACRRFEPGCTLCREARQRQGLPAEPVQGSFPDSRPYNSLSLPELPTL